MAAAQRDATPARADEEIESHGLSAFGDLAYEPNFAHFGYVEPNAPKGGVFSQIGPNRQYNQNFLTFNSLNSYILRGDAAQGMELTFATLMTRAGDEPDAMYGLAAEKVSRTGDGLTYRFFLRPQAKFHDGTKLTAHDVAFSLNILKEKGHPLISQSLRDFAGAEAADDAVVVVRFAPKRARDVPLFVAGLPIFSRAYYTAKPFDETTLDAPLGSGPYKVKQVAPGRTILYEKVADYWGKDINVNVGSNNFDQIRFDYYRDTTVALEAFKADQLDFRTENSAKNWATGYDFPAVNDKRVVLEKFPVRNVGMMQAFAFNIRRDKFKDARLRRAFNFAFNFDEMNRQIFFGQYQRIDSYFSGTELAATGLPSGLELEILQTVKDKVPAELFTKPYSNPVNGNPQAVRTNLREALTLLRAAGYEVRNTKLTDTKTNTPLTVEFLVEDPATERFVLFYKPSLERIGIGVSVRTVDAAQYENRLRQWDYDIVVASWAESLSPGNEQRNYWSSQAADIPGSRNVVGIKNPAVDELINRVVFAKSREELVAATKALDRVLLWNFYVVPQWTYPFQRTARWDRFGHPETMPKYGQAAFPNIWWWDKDKAAKVPQRS